MTTYLSIDLQNIPVDTELVNSVPYGLALYYLALPLARENGRASVAMARPDNGAALSALRGLLRADIVPVVGAADEIRTAIHAWSASAASQPAVAYLATIFSDALKAPVTVLGSSDVDSDTMLTIAREGRYALTVLTTPGDIPLPVLLRRSAAPMLLVRGDHTRLQRLLFVSRGFASDDQVLEWMMPIWKKAAAATWLPLLESSLHSLAGALSVTGPMRRHIEQQLHRLEQSTIPVQLRLRQGPLAEQVAAELHQESYDLLVIAAEGQGDFVAEVLQRIEACGAHAGRPIFILKPPFPVQPISKQ
jgi:hypothetical protein